MKLQAGRTPYRKKCDIDGCKQMGVYALDARVSSASGRLHLCEECWRELAKLYAIQMMKDREMQKIAL